jgi:hypothetical protein
MSYTAPVPYVTKSDLTAPGPATNYWSAADANAIKSAFDTTYTNLNTVSGSLNVLSGAYTDMSATVTERSSSLELLWSEWNAGESTQFSESLAITASVYFQKILLGTDDLSQISVDPSIIAHPTATYNNLREAFYTLTATLNNSATLWNKVSASAFTTSSNWNPDGGVFSVTGSLYITGNFSGSSGTFTAPVTVSSSLEITGTAATTLYIHSPNGSRWAITVGNDGVLSSTLA